MPNHFRIEMLPASYGDCLWIEYGDENASHRILVDGGLNPTYEHLIAKLGDLPEADRTLELVVCTHIDLDHIRGLLKLFGAPLPGLRIGDVWFNGWDQIKDYLDLDPGVLGFMEGEKLDALVELHGLPQNQAFDGKAAVVQADETPQVILLPGGMQVTLLGPTPNRLQKLAKAWHDYFIDKQLDPDLVFDGELEEPEHDIGVLGTPNVGALANAPFKEDTAVNNGSSIAFILEFGGKRALLTGDAFPSDVRAGLKQWCDTTGDPLARVDAFKLSHHGGKPNTSPELLAYVDCTDYLISTNGVSHQHPSPETIARILEFAPNNTNRRLHFNYRTEFNEDWDNAELQGTHNYETNYPADGTEGIRVTLL
ncbi:MAG: MBL fold metallo-hydrolase [Prosthecobacter sp.]|nr:MBL fold metallo-hydrolase [Prosthecobacter sp.]